MNGNKLSLNKIKQKNYRILPNWSLELKEGKAYIKYYYKSFYKGDNTETLLLDDNMMNVTMVGNNHGYKPKKFLEPQRVLLTK